MSQIVSWLAYNATIIYLTLILFFQPETSIDSKWKFLFMLAMFFNSILVGWYAMGPLRKADQKFTGGTVLRTFLSACVGVWVAGTLIFQGQVVLGGLLNIAYWAAFFAVANRYLEHQHE